MKKTRGGVRKGILNYKISRHRGVYKSVSVGGRWGMIVESVS